MAADIDRNNGSTFSGEIFYLKELEGEFSVSLKLTGFSKRANAMSSHIVEVSCVGGKELYEEMRRQQIGMYCNATVSGYIEMWPSKRDRHRLIFIAESIAREEPE